MGDVVAVLLAWPDPLGGQPQRWALADSTRLRVELGVVSVVDPVAPAVVLTTGPVCTPLWWDGRFVPEGWDRAKRVYAAASRAVGHVETAAEIMAKPDPLDADDALQMAHALVGFTVAYADRGHGIASRIVCLARDADGRLVEVTP